MKTVLILSAILCGTILQAQTDSFGVNNDSTIYKLDSVDVKPEFPGGDSMLTVFMRRVVYPMKAKDVGIQGLVIVKYIIEKDGLVAHAEVSQSSGNELLDKEGLRRVHLMPRWKPAYLGGRPVRVEAMSGFNFTISE